MAVFRIEKTQNYTVMSNHHLRNKSLSLKAKGLLSQILSLPENWDYTLSGLSLINRESIDAIRTAVSELERAGYITRSRIRKENGQLGSAEYVIRELPPEGFTPEDSTPEESSSTPVLPISPAADSPGLRKPISGEPIWENPIQVNPALEKETQLNKDIIITKESNKDLANNHQSIYPDNEKKEPPESEIDRMDGLAAEIENYRAVIKENIAYEHLCLDYEPERVTEILELILETVCSARKYIRIGGEDYPAEVVKNRFMKLTQHHVEYVFDCIQGNTTDVRNIKAYLITTLYNAPTTISHYYTAKVSHDFYGSG